MTNKKTIEIQIAVKNAFAIESQKETLYFDAFVTRDGESYFFNTKRGTNFVITLDEFIKIKDLLSKIEEI